MMRFSHKGLHKLRKGGSVSPDIAEARAIIEDSWPIGPGRNAKGVIGSVFEALKRVERKLPSDELRMRPRRWTHRRVQAIWNRQARRIDNYEMADLQEAALEAAIEEHRNAVRKTERLAAFIAAHQKTDDRTLAEKLGEFVG